jgi:hypothetical protein
MLEQGCMLWESVFLVTGIVQTIGAQWLYYQGAAHSFSFLTVTAAYLGMMMVYFADAPLNRNASSTKYNLLSAESFPYIPVIFVSLMDFVANVCVTIGMFLIGSGVWRTLLLEISSNLLPLFPDWF